MTGHFLVSGVDMTSLLPSLAAKLAHAGSDVQGQFFKVFAQELVSACETEYGKQMQCHHIQDDAKFNEAELDVFGCIGMERDSK